MQFIELHGGEFVTKKHAAGDYLRPNDHIPGYVQVIAVDTFHGVKPYMDAMPDYELVAFASLPVKNPSPKDRSRYVSMVFRKHDAEVVDPETLPPELGFLKTKDTDKCKSN